MTTADHNALPGASVLAGDLVCQIFTDSLLQCDHGPMSTATKLVLRQARKEAFDEVRRLVRAVVVQDQVNLEIFRHHLVDVPQEADEVAASVPPLELADDLACGNVQKRRTA